jgi:hypothetical protein
MREFKWLPSLVSRYWVTRLALINVLLYVCVSGTTGGAPNVRKDWTWDPDQTGRDGLPGGRPLILGHRGSCGMYPEHTSLSHEEAARQGADVLECDMVLTKVSRGNLSG